MTNYETALYIIASQNLTDEQVAVAREIMTECCDLYHNGTDGEETYLTDDEYDAFSVICYKNEKFGKVRVGAEVRGGKIKLPFVLGSLDQTYDDETLKWVKDNGWEDELFVISDKQDGVSGASVHNTTNGLDIAYSRGDGTMGADITRHIDKIPSYSHAKRNVKIRYEVIFPYQDFYDMKENFEKNNSSKFYKNPRNYVAGKMNAETSPQEFYEGVNVIVTSLIDSNMDKIDQYEFARKLGFSVTPYTVVRGSELTQEFLTKHLLWRKSVSPTELDGIVIDINDSKIRESLNWDDKNPPYAKKFKVNASGVKTTVTNVIWRASKDGYMKPRIEVVPVDINGVTITYCTGFNAGFIRDNKINIGSEILITRQGDVIPHCSAVVTQSSEPLLPDETVYGSMSWTETGVDLIVDNKDEVEETIIGKMLHFSNTLKINGLKKGSITKLVNAGIKTLEELILLPETKYKEIVGESAGETIYAGIKKSLTNVRFEVLLDASQTLGRGVGESTGKVLIENLSYEDFMGKNFTVASLESLPDIGEKTAQLIYTNHQNFVDFVKDIEGNVTITFPAIGELTGIEFLMTGIRDNLLQEAIIARGGKMCSSVSAKKDMYLICADVNSSSSKIKKAKDVLPSDRIIDIDTARQKWL